MMHSARFPRQYRELIPELVGIQLRDRRAGRSGRRQLVRPADGGILGGGRTVPETVKQPKRLFKRDRVSEDHESVTVSTDDLLPIGRPV